MTSAPPAERSPLGPLQVVLLALVIMTVGGGMLLLSAAEPVARVDGAIPWREQSLLRAVVSLLCLGYQLPTPYPDAVKTLVLGIGCGAALLALALALLARSQDDASVCGSMQPCVNGTDGEHDEPSARVVQAASAAASGRKIQMPPLVAAQSLIVLYLLWALASGRWSPAPDMTHGAAALLAIQLLWALAIGNGLTPSVAAMASRWVLGILSATALLAIWYYYGRNPTLRAAFPVGNPVFLAACLIPGVLLATGLALESFARLSSLTRASLLARAALVTGSLFIMLWTLRLADSRGAYLGLTAGSLAMAYFSLRGRWRWVPTILAIAVALAAWRYFHNAVQPGSLSVDSPASVLPPASPGGRAESARLRTYAWRYAWQMFTQRPLTGHGHGAYALLGDSFTVADVASDPQVFEARIVHAHNEWLEVLADLGSIGLVLVVAALLLTLRAGLVALGARPPPAERWTLAALMAGIVGLGVHESFNVGLRVGPVPTTFYTVLGLSWALSRHGAHPLVLPVTRTRLRRIAASAGLVILGPAMLLLARQDFTAARRTQQVSDALSRSDFDRAVRLAEAGTVQLNPQRALTAYFRLVEVHLEAARFYQDRAFDRETRAAQDEPPNARLLALAETDYTKSDLICEKGSGWLKELVRRAPGFLHHGWLEYWLNRIRAANLTARNDPGKQKALVQNAVVAIERELLRQPFHPGIAADYAELAVGVRPTELVIDALARPLRYHRIGARYADLLQRLAADVSFTERMESVVRGVQAIESTISPAQGTPLAVDPFAPEKLRLGAALHFLRGDYETAQALLSNAVAIYETIASAAPIGAASGYGELADSHFYAAPLNAEAYLASAARALELAPASAVGRQLVESIRTRMIGYHLAAGDEDEAIRLLWLTAPPGAGETDVQRELAARYRRLCESLLARRNPAGASHGPPAKLMTTMHGWVSRAIELDPNDPASHYVAANLALQAGDDALAADHVRRAADLGMPTELAVRFIKFSLEKMPKSNPLRSLQREFADLQSVEQAPWARRTDDNVSPDTPRRNSLGSEND